MAGNSRGPEGVFSRFLVPTLTTIAPMVTRVENEVGSGTSDIYVADNHWSAWVEIKSTTVDSRGMIDLTLFTLDQRKFLMNCPGRIGGFLLCEIRQGPKSNWGYAIWDKNSLPAAQCKYDWKENPPTACRRSGLKDMLSIHLNCLTY